MKWIVAGIAMPMALAMGGCAGGGFTWQKPGTTDTDLRRDAYECERDVRAAAGSFSGGVFGAGEAQAFGQRCMLSKGWSMVPN